MGDLAAVGANAVGQSWGSGQNPLAQTLGNAAVGALAAKATGKDAAAGAIGGAVETALGNVVDLPVDPATGQYADTTKGAYQLAAMLAAAGVAAAAGKDGITAALAAQNAAVNNRLMTQVEKDRVKQLAQNTGLTEDRLARAACYEVKCWAQYPEGSAAREKAFVSIGEVIDLSKELAAIRTEKTSSGLFNYTMTQQDVDDFKSGPLPTIESAAKVVGGGLTAWTGGTICGATSGAGCVIGGGSMIAFGTSEFTEGATGLYNQYQRAGSAGINPLRTAFNTVSPVWGDTVYDTGYLISSGVSLWATVPAKIGASDGINRASSMFGVTVQRWQNPVISPMTNEVIMTNNALRPILLFGVGAKALAVEKDIEQIRSGK